MSDDVKRLIELLERNCGDIELVSYGLAPNPFGFCYEVYGKVPVGDLIKIDVILSTMSDEDEEVIRDTYLR